jgi:hypothetical protein
MCVKSCLYTLIWNNEKSCHVKTLQEPSLQLYILWAFEFVGICWDEPKIKPCGTQMLMTKPRVLASMIWWDNVNLALSHSMVKISSEFLLKIKQGKFLNGHITYQSHMSISKHKPSTYACMWPIEFCQIVVTLDQTLASCSVTFSVVLLSLISASSF